MKKSLKSKFRFKMLKNGPNMTKSIQIKQIKSFLTKFQSPKLLRRCPNKSNKCLKWSKSNSCLAQILIHFCKKFVEADSEIDVFYIDILVNQKLIKNYTEYTFLPRSQSGPKWFFKSPYFVHDKRTPKCAMFIFKASI